MKKKNYNANANEQTFLLIIYGNVLKNMDGYGRLDVLYVYDLSSFLVFVGLNFYARTCNVEFSFHNPFKNLIPESFFQNVVAIYNIPAQRTPEAMYFCIVEYTYRMCMI